MLMISKEIFKSLTSRSAQFHRISRGMEFYFHWIKTVHETTMEAKKYLAFEYFCSFSENFLQLLKKQQ